MKISASRKAISQSIDLFIIIAAVLSVGGIVAATAYSLVNAGSSASNIQVTSLTLTGGSASSTNPPVLSLTLKNSGNSIIPLGTTSSITIAGVTGVPSTNCVPISYAGTSTVSWTGTCSVATASVQWIGPTPSVSLAPGGQLSFSVTFGGASSTFAVTTGNSYTITILLGSVSYTVKTIAQ